MSNFRATRRAAPTRLHRRRGNPLSGADYRIDYDDLDVNDLVEQIRERSRRAEGGVADPPAALEERLLARLRTAVDLDEKRPYELQRALRLEGDWNVAPQDLVASNRPGAGALRRLLRPLRKLFANLELPLYKQFKVNLGVAEALHELLQRAAELEVRLDDISRRLEALEGDRPGSSED